MKEQLDSYQKREEEEFQSLYEKVPENFKELLTDDLPLSKRLQMAKKFAKETKSAPPGYRPPGEGAQPTLEQQIKAAKSSKELKEILAART